MRMGYPKALLPLGGETFLTRILRILRDAGMAKPRLILGRAAPRIEPQIRDWPVEILINPDPSRGQLSSIQLGLRGLPESFDAAMIWPVDQPAVTVDLVQRLAKMFLDSECRIALPMFGTRRGHPAIFHRALFREFMDAPLAEGPKGILQRHQAYTELLPTEEPACVEDIDTPTEYQALTGEALDSALGSVRGFGSD